MNNQINQLYISEFDIFTFKQYIINELICSYNMSKFEVEKAFRQ